MVRPWSLAAAGAVLVLGSATVGSAEASTTACYAGSLGGQAAVRSGWADDRPGLCRLVTRSALPPPFATASADNHPHAIPRPAGALPKAPPGFRVSLFFQDGTAPRQLRAAPNGDLFLAESYAGQVRVLRPDGKGGLATSAVFAPALPAVRHRLLPAGAEPGLGLRRQHRHGRALPLSPTAT